MSCLLTTMQIVNAMGTMVNDSMTVRTAFGQTADGFQTLVEMYGREDAPDIFLSTLSTTVCRLTYRPTTTTTTTTILPLDRLSACGRTQNQPEVLC